MCLIKVKINGVRYSVATAEKVAENLVRELEAAKADRNEMFEKYRAKENVLFATEAELVESKVNMGWLVEDNAELRAENSKLREELLRLKGEKKQPAKRGRKPKNQVKTE